MAIGDRFRNFAKHPGFISWSAWPQRSTCRTFRALITQHFSAPCVGIGTTTDGRRARTEVRSVLRATGCGSWQLRTASDMQHFTQLGHCSPIALGCYLPYLLQGSATFRAQQSGSTNSSYERRHDSTATGQGERFLAHTLRSCCSADLFVRSLVIPLCVWVSFDRSKLSV